MLIVHLFVVVIILQCRRQVAEAIRRAGRPRGRSRRVRNRVAGLCTILRSPWSSQLWAVWALNIRNGYSLLLQYSSVPLRSC